MDQIRTMEDAAVIFTALRADAVISLLSSLDTHDAQRLLATAAKLQPDSTSLSRAASRLAAELELPQSIGTQDFQSNNQSTSSSTTTDKVDPRPRAAGERKTVSHPTESLGFLIDLPDAEIRMLLSKVNTACWAPALASEPAAVREIIFSNVATTVEQILKREIAAFDGNDDVAQSSRNQIRAAADSLHHSFTQIGLKRAS